MVATGPWQLPELKDNGLEYGVVPLPSYSGKPMTISGPDTWTIFDNGKAKVKAATEFVTWLADPAQDIQWDIKGGSLPITKATAELPQWKKHSTETNGLEVFVTALDTAKVRPTISTYPQISEHMGQAIAAVLLGKQSPARCVEAGRGPVQPGTGGAELMASVVGTFTVDPRARGRPNGGPG